MDPVGNRNSMPEGRKGSIMQNTEFTKEELDELCYMIKNKALEEGLDVEVKLSNMNKVGDTYIGMSIEDTAPNASDLVPVLRVDDYFNFYKNAVNNGNCRITAMEMAADRALDDNRTLSKMYIGGSGLEHARQAYSSWKELKKDVILHAVGKTKAKEYLKDKPHTVLGDICAVYGIEIKSEDSKEIGFIPVTKELAKKVGASTKDLHKAAVENTRERFPMVTQTIEGMLGIMDLDNQVSGLYIITNSEMRNGAACIFYPEFKEAVANLLPTPYGDGSVAILPSSRHEVFVTPVEDNEGLKVLREMVTQINEEQVKPHDQLSDKPTVFDGRSLLPKFGEKPFEMKFKNGKKQEKSR